MLPIVRNRSETVDFFLCVGVGIRCQIFLLVHDLYIGYTEVLALSLFLYIFNLPRMPRKLKKLE